MRAGQGGGASREGTLSRSRKWSRRSSVTGFLKRKLSLSRGRGGGGQQVSDSHGQWTQGVKVVQIPYSDKWVKLC